MTIIIKESQYYIGMKVNAAWSENNIRAKGEIVDKRYHNEWEYQIEFDGIYINPHHNWYKEFEILGSKNKFVERW